MGHVYVRPTPDVEKNYADRVRLRARRQAQYAALRDKPCVTKDGEKISLLLNAGLLVDLPHIAETGASGIGLFRTELQFMVTPSLPRIGEQLSLYRQVLDAAEDRPVTFRTLDIGGDKVLPYMRFEEEENPALGYRAIRLGLDRPGLLRSQIRALLDAAADRELRIMFPMVTTVDEFDQAKGFVERELTHLRRHGHTLARAGACRRHGGGAGTALSARRIARARRFPVDRLERPGAVHVRGRPQQCAARQPLRLDLAADAARAEIHRRQGARGRKAGDAMRRACLAADRRARPDRDRLPLDVAFGLRRSAR